MWTYLGVHGMDVHSGFTSPNLLEAETDRALIDAGRRLIVVADHTKWGVIGLSSIARLNQADVLITDSGLDPEAREILASHVKELVVVEPRQPAALLRPGAALGEQPVAEPASAAPASPRPRGREPIPYPAGPTLRR